MSGHYGIGQHSSEIDNLHVFLEIDGESEDLFDVVLYSLTRGYRNDSAFIESKAALELMVELANEGRRLRQWEES